MGKTLSSLVCNGVTLQNRFVLPAMATGKADENGLVTEEILQYYDEKTRGGYLQLVITEHHMISAQGCCGAHQMSAGTDAAVPGMRRLAETMHANGARCLMQLNHGGGCGEPANGLERIAPSAIVHPRCDTAPRAMTIEEIAQTVADFRDAALRAQAAGFDGVEIHSAHGYLLNQFYSPLGNQRTDAYGGSLEKRLRIHQEVLRAVREAVGKDFLIALRLGGSDYREGGSTIEDAVAAATILAACGIDLLDISGGYCGFTHPHVQEPGWFADVSIPVKQAVSVPVILTGGVTSRAQAEALLQRGAADMIGVGRSVLGDAGWAAREIGQ